MAQTQKAPEKPKRKIVGQGYVVEARALSLSLQTSGHAIEISYPLKQNGLEASPGQFVTIFDDGKFHIGELPKDWQ